MNTRLINTGLFILTGFIGFWSVSICYFTLSGFGIISDDYFLTQDRLPFQTWSSIIIGLWFVCLLFSFGGIFINKKERYILYAAPLIIPIVYGFGSILINS